MNKSKIQRLNRYHDKQPNKISNRRRHKTNGYGRRSTTHKEGRLAKNAVPIEVTITHIGGRGDGVGKALYEHNHQSREPRVFVPASLPSERALAQPLSLNNQGIGTRMIELIEPAQDRSIPACDAFPACGGCQFQHWLEPVVSVWKQTQVAECFKRNNIWPTQVRPILSVPFKSR